MKKFIIIMLAVCATMLSSCNKKNEKPLPGLENMIVFEQNGRYGLKTVKGNLFLDCIYDSIDYNKELEVIVANYGEFTDLYRTSGCKLLSDQISSISPDIDAAGFYRVTNANNQVYLIASPTACKEYDITAMNCWGKLQNISVKGKYLFTKDHDKWGISTLNLQCLAPRLYERVYIVQNEKTFGVLVYDNKWKLYNHDGIIEGVRYNLDSKKLEKRLQKFDLTYPYGVLKVDWNL